MSFYIWKESSIESFFFSAYNICLSYVSAQVD